MLLLRAVHRPPGSMVRSACYGSSSGVKSPSRRLLVRCEEAEADVCDAETHNSFPDDCVCGVRSPAHTLLHKVRFRLVPRSPAGGEFNFKPGRRAPAKPFRAGFETTNVLRSFSFAIQNPPRGQLATGNRRLQNPMRLTVTNDAYTRVWARVQSTYIK